MPAVVVVGSQWGDEGKGKFVDYFAKDSDGVVRFQGGANAGHTLIVNGKKTVLHLVPSGILHPHTQCFIASGTVLDIYELKQEIEMVQASGLDVRPERLKISGLATLVLPFHKILDGAREAKEKLGTTKRGIGPAYEDRSSRRAILFKDLFASDLKEKISHLLEEKNCLFKNLYGLKEIDANQVYEELLTVVDFFRPFFMANMGLHLNNLLDQNKKLLFEGAQGALLDIFHGNYPFVTSSSTISAAACLGSGIGPQRISKVVGVAKAYCTRVGAGPFPTELTNGTGEQLRTIGAEFGATTGRPRRCGWLDLVALKYSVKINGINSIVLTKMDVLNQFDEIRVCYDYVNGANDLMNADTKPLYKEFKGWKSDISAHKQMAELPSAVRAYVDYIEEQVEVPVEVVSVGADRSQTIGLSTIF